MELKTSCTYWKADKKTSAAIDELLDLHKPFMKAACKIASRFRGADKKNVYTVTRMGGRVCFTGVIFKNEADVDQKLFCKLKNTSHGWRPRGGPSKAAKALSAEFGAVTCESLPKIMDLLGLDYYSEGGWSTPGVCVIGDVAYLSVSHRNKKPLKGCKRICDVDYEKAVKPGPTMRRKN